MNVAIGVFFVLTGLFLVSVGIVKLHSHYHKPTVAFFNDIDGQYNMEDQWKLGQPPPDA